MGNVIIVLKQWSYELGKIFKFDQTELINFDQTELMKQVKEADEVNKNSSNEILLDSSSYKIHSGAIYTSRLLNYNNLPEPKNSVDYYKQNDNIISKKFLESLHDIPQQIEFQLISIYQLSDNEL
ncbi:hypothetical protein RclHR1_01430018 [Rhizophagus clarus]|uniref:Uncharacterized protein n=1 Tax=Rhizophagus clarus TaxID=94130 RepID=A0A2Z6QPK1_9GLOM|nr:hypothetical protein RclHR1_01430018 [Rhizophagus clarus]